MEEVHWRMRRIPVTDGRTLVATPVFETYWRFAHARQEIFLRRVSGEPIPWTDDTILGRYRFTNVYRVTDRVSQFLLRSVIYQADSSLEEIFFRTILFKLFNRIETWQRLCERLGGVSWRDYDYVRYAGVLDEILAEGGAVYSGAYIMPAPPFGESRKHRGHLRLLEHMMLDHAAHKVAACRSLGEVFRLLRGYPSLGDFLAFQFAIDLNYSELIDFPEMEFVVAGPGARSGIEKCFVDKGGLSEADLIRAVTDLAAFECERLGLPVLTLWGRPLQLIDCQNVFCEVDKYARVVHPAVSTGSGRTRIKQRFRPRLGPVPAQWYPPKWGLRPLESAHVRGDGRSAELGTGPIQSALPFP